MRKSKIAVVIPCYRVRGKVGEVISAIPDFVWQIYCVDDACPEGSGDFVESLGHPKVKVLRHESNQGVGGAVVTGYRQALKDGARIIVKIDGDGQMDPKLIPFFVRPILHRECDYTKGNRFYRPSDVKNMPRARLLGNAALSFLNKLSSGYWHVFDPNNGYTAVHARVLQELPLEKLHKKYFFESDMLFRLNTVHAAVHDIPMRAIYADENSSLIIRKVVLPFVSGHLANFLKRLAYNYFLRDFSLASLLLVCGSVLLAFGLSFVGFAWIESAQSGEPASAGAVMLGALPVFLGVQFLVSFLQYDIAATPRVPLHTHIAVDGKEL